MMGDQGSIFCCVRGRSSFGIREGKWLVGNSLELEVIMIVANVVIPLMN